MSDSISTALIPTGGDAISFLRLFLEGRTATTIRAYQNDLDDFGRFAGVSPPEALRLLFNLGAGGANEAVLRYRSDLGARGLKASTINRRMATLRSVAKFARTIGAIDWELAVRGVKSQPYRDTRGPGVDGVRKMLKLLKARGDAKAARDAAIVRLLFDCALRCSEVVSLDAEHVDLDGAWLLVHRKGRVERESVALPEPTMKAIREWLGHRGDEGGPLFLNLERSKRGGRLSANGLYRMIVRLGKEIGRRVRPHGLRHAAVTQALELTGGDVRSVAKFSSHRSIQTVLLYDDARQDVAGEVARAVAESV